MSKFRKGSILVALTSVAALVFAFTAFGAPATSSATAVSVTAGKPTEFGYVLSKKTAPKGLITFTVTNRGAINHDFKIAGKKTPSLAAGKKAVLKVTITKPGKYRYLCTLPGHATGGMQGFFTVK